MRRAATRIARSASRAARTCARAARRERAPAQLLTPAGRTAARIAPAHLARGSAAAPDDDRPAGANADTAAGAAVDAAGDGTDDAAGDGTATTTTTTTTRRGGGATSAVKAIGAGDDDGAAGDDGSLAAERRAAMARSLTTTARRPRTTRAAMRMGTAAAQQLKANLKGARAGGLLPLLVRDVGRAGGHGVLLGLHRRRVRVPRADDDPPADDAGAVTAVADDDADTSGGAADGTCARGCDTGVAGCYARYDGDALSGGVAQVEFVQSRVSAQGAGRGVGGWDGARRAMNGNMTDYHGFTDDALVYYLDDLGAHVRQFVEDRVPFLARRYAKKDDTMYTALVALPGSGNAVELQAPACASCEAGLGVVFLEFASLGECPGSHTMLHDVEWYHQQYAARYVDVTLENGLPAPMLVMSKHAVSNWTRVADDLAASFPEYSAAYDVHRAEGEGCTYASLPMYVSDSEHYQIDVRFVHNPTARTPAGGVSWREYEEDVRSTHQELLHLLQWDAYLDSHLQIWPDATLDTYARRMDDVGMWWRAFNGSCTQESGTAHRFNFYSSGIAGVHGVRLHRPITDGTFVPAGKLPLSPDAAYGNEPVPPARTLA